MLGKSKVFLCIVALVGLTSYSALASPCRISIYAVGISCLPEGTTDLSEGKFRLLVEVNSDDFSDCKGGTSACGQYNSSAGYECAPSDRVCFNYLDSGADICLTDPACDE